MAITAFEEKDVFGSKLILLLLTSRHFKKNKACYPFTASTLILCYVLISFTPADSCINSLFESFLFKNSNI